MKLLAILLLASSLGTGFWLKSTADC